MYPFQECLVHLRKEPLDQTVSLRPLPSRLPSDSDFFNNHLTLSLARAVMSDCERSLRFVSF